MTPKTQNAPKGAAKGAASMPLPVRARVWYESLPLQISFALAGRQYPRPKPPAGEQVTVALCQTKFSLVGRAADFAGKMYRFVRAAVQKGAQLVVFPEHTGLQLLGLWSNITQYAGSTSLDGAAEHLGLDLADMFRMIAPASGSIYNDTFSILAQRFGVHIAAGSLILPDKDGELHNSAYLFGPRGTLLGVQHKLHLAPAEADWLTPGHELKVFELPFGKVVLAVGADSRYWEFARLAWLNGAEIMAGLAADTDGGVVPLRARGVRVRMQELPAYGLHTFMLADLFDLHWRGQSSVYAPAALLPPEQSTLAESRGDNDEEVVATTLDLAALRKLRRESAPEFNVGLFLKYVPAAYQKYQENALDGRLLT